MFYDDELHEISCDLVHERLEEHFKLEPEDVFYKSLKIISLIF